MGDTPNKVGDVFQLLREDIRTREMGFYRTISTHNLLRIESGFLQTNSAGVRYGRRLGTACVKELLK